MIFIQQAIFALDPKIVTIRDDIAYDAEENVVEYDKEAAQAKLEQMQAEEITSIQAREQAKKSALVKLKNIGLTDAEISALTGN